MEPQRGAGDIRRRGLPRPFARDAGISVNDVAKAAPATTAAVLRHLPSAQIHKVLDQLPEEIRALLMPSDSTKP